MARLHRHPPLHQGSAVEEVGDTIFALNKGLEVRGVTRFERDGVRWEKLVTARQTCRV